MLWTVRRVCSHQVLAGATPVQFCCPANFYDCDLKSLSAGSAHNRLGQGCAERLIKLPSNDPAWRVHNLRGKGRLQCRTLFSLVRKFNECPHVLEIRHESWKQRALKPFLA